MAIEVQLAGVEELNTLVREMPAHAYTGARQVFADAVFRTHRKILQYDGGLMNRTGALRRSMKTRVMGSNLNTLKGFVWTTSLYAPLQEKGGTIVAKNAYRNVPGGPYLNIPLNDNRTARGVMRESARDVFAGGGTIFKSRSGKWFVKSGTDKLMFILVKQVDVPARLGMIDAAEDEIPTMISELNNIRLE